MVRTRSLSAAVALALVVAVAGCSSSAKSSSSTTTSAGGGVSVTTPATGSTVDITVNDTSGVNGPMTLVATPSTVPAGDVTFTVKNTGTIDHEVIVLKLASGQTFDKLAIADAGDPPVAVATGANKVDEGASVGETGAPNLKPGETRTFTIKAMVAGGYALVCNIADHYKMGMRAPLTVK